MEICTHILHNILQKKWMNVGPAGKVITFRLMQDQHPAKKKNHPIYIPRDVPWWAISSRSVTLVVLLQILHSGSIGQLWDLWGKQLLGLKKGSFNHTYGLKLGQYCLLWVPFPTQRIKSFTDMLQYCCWKSFMLLILIQLHIIFYWG